VSGPELTGGGSRSAGQGCGSHYVLLRLSQGIQDRAGLRHPEYILKYLMRNKKNPLSGLLISAGPTGRILRARCQPDKHVR